MVARVQPSVAPSMRLASPGAGKLGEVSALDEVGSLQHETLGERVTGELRALLIAGRLAPGEKLSLRRVAEALGVSMMPVREAVSRLAADKALEVLPGRAVRVPVLTLAQFRELTRIRLVVEGFAGNIALKTAEGTAKQIGQYLKDAMMRTWASRLGALLARGGFRVLKEKMDPRRVNGGTFLGLHVIAVKSHGGIDALGFASAVDLGYEMAESELLQRLAADLAAFQNRQGSVAPANDERRA